MKKVLISLSVILNVLVVIAAVWLFSGGATTLMRDNFIQPNWERWSSQFAALPVEDGDVVFLGDSITEGGAWEDLFPDVATRNRGIGGDTTSGILLRMEPLVAAAPAKVFILIGTNDIAFGAADEEILTNLTNIIDQLRQAGTQQVYVQSILPRGVEFQSRIEALNKKIATQIKGSAEFVDLYPHFLDPGDGSIRNDYSNDELHLLGPGYVLWRDLINPLVNAS